MVGTYTNPRPGRYRLKAAVVALILTGSACAAPVDTAAAPPGENVGFDPVSLRDLAHVGGSTSLALSNEEIAKQSQIAVVAVVTDVQPSRLNTRDAAFPSAKEIEAGGLDDLVVLTDVEVKIVRTVGAGTNVADIAAGEILVVTVGGGTIFTSLDADQAAALGVMEVVGDGGQLYFEEGEIGPEPGSELEVPVDGPVERFLWGSAPDEDLTEGDTVVLFLTRLSIDGYQGAPVFEYWTPVHPSGVFQRTDGGDWVGPSNQRAVDVDALAKLIP